MPEFENMVCIVGENPLPIWLGIHQFAPKNRPTNVILVYSGGTADVAKNIKQQLSWERNTNAHKVNCICDDAGKIADPFSPPSVRKALLRLETKYKLTEAKYVLNYTGGTKVMSAHTLLYWFQKAAIGSTFYLEEANAQFHFDTGDPEKIRETTHLTLEALYRLHDASKLPKRALPGCGFNDCSELLKDKMYEARDTLAERLNRMTHSWTDNYGKPVTKNIHYLRENHQFDWLNSQRDPDTDWKIECLWGDLLSLLPMTTAQRWSQTPFPTKAEYKKGQTVLNAQFRFFANNFWFEMWVYCLLQRLLNTTKGIASGQEFRIGGQRFESDILTVVDHRLCYISVTTNPDEAACKEKMFEAIHRSKQIGGGLARSCVISLASENDNGEDVVRNCRRSVTGADSGGNHTIFGFKHVEQWMDPTAPCTDLLDFLNRKGEFAK